MLLIVCPWSKYLFILYCFMIHLYFILITKTINKTVNCYRKTKITKIMPSDGSYKWDP